MTQQRQVKNPFPGLRPFETDEYRLFFGREGQSDELLRRLQRSRFLAVVGTSGSGKSSLIRAGLLPALRGGMMAGAGSGWRIAVMRPGGDPIGNLAQALAQKDVLAAAGGGLSTGEAEAMIEATLRGGSLGLVDAAYQGRFAEHEKLLVVVDQFEELFRFRSAQEKIGTGDEASAFVKLLIEAAQQRELSIYVVLTMRSDFLGDCAQFQGLPEAINEGQYLIPRMTRDERRFAVTGPVGVTRGKITEPLVNRLLNDVGDNPDQLPILQHALMRTWDHWSTSRRDGEPIGLEHYEAVGTMSDALSRHADEAWAELDQRQQVVAELLFKTLTERGADNREIRRPTSLQDICAITNATPAEVGAVIEVFRGAGRSFLMPPAGVPLKPETVVDISHESLIRNWNRLRAWVEDEAQSARIYRRLAEAATDHHQNGTGLLDDVTLQFVLKWRDQSKPGWAWGVRYHPEFNTAMSFLELSTQARDARLAAEQERERRELETTRAFAAQQAHAAQRLRRFAFALVIISLLAFCAAGGAVYAYTVARTNQQRAEASEKRTRDLAGNLQESQRSVAAGKQEVAEGRRFAGELQTKAEALQKTADDKAQKAAAAERRAAAAKAVADQAAGVAKASEIKAKTALDELSTATRNDQLNRDALAYFQRGNAEQAEAGFKNLAEIYQEEPLKLAWAKSHLGEVHRRLGRVDQGIADLQEAYEIQKAVIGEAPKTKTDRQTEYQDTLNWLAQAHSDNGEYELAEPLYLVAVSFDRSADNLEKLARNHDNLVEVEEAETIYDEALTLRRKNPNSPALITALQEVAEFSLEHDRLSKAADLYLETLKNQEAYLEPYDANIADTFTGLSQVYEEMGLRGRAKLYNGLARAIRRSGLTERSTDGGSMQLVAQHYAEIGKYRQAAWLEVRAQEIHAKDQGAESQGPVNSLIALGDFFRDAAKSAPESGERGAFYDRAQETYGRALEISERKTYAVEQGRALDGLARLQLEHKNFAEAERLYQRVLEMREQKTTSQVFPAEEMIDNLEGLAAASTGLGKYAEAEAYLLRALKTFDGMTHYTLLMRNIDPALLRLSISGRLAEVYRSQGRMKDAEDLYRPMAEQLQKEVKNNSGINTADYLDLVEQAGRFFSERGDTAAAEAFYLLVWPPEIRPAVSVVPVWPDAYAKSLMATAPITSVPSIVRILESYSALLATKDRGRESDLVSHGIGRMHERLLLEGFRSPASATRP